MPVQPAPGRGAASAAPGLAVTSNTLSGNPGQLGPPGRAAARVPLGPPRRMGGLLEIS